jgi:hypothetical protein
MNLEYSMPFDITVSRKEFILALKQVKKFNKGKKPFELVLKLAGDILIIESPLTIQRVAATGMADIKITLPGRVILRMIGDYSRGDTIRFIYEGSVLKIDGLSIPCGREGYSEDSCKYQQI